MLFLEILQIIDEVVEEPCAQYYRKENVTWEEYEAILEKIGDGRGSRISFNDVTLEVVDD